MQTPLEGACQERRRRQVVDVFIRCSTAPIAVVAPMYAPFYEDSARDRLPITDPLLSFSARSPSSALAPCCILRP